MKECDRIADLFVELHDTQLDGTMESTAMRHLHNCPGCREDFKWYGITVQALSDLERMQPPDDFLEQLHARLHAPSFSESLLDSFRNLFTTFPHLPLPVGVTALTFVVAVAFAVYQYAPTPVPAGVAATELIQTPGGAAPGRDAASPETANSNRMIARPYAASPSTPSAAFTTASLPTSKSISPDYHMRTSAPRAEAVSAIGADNLVVESASMDRAVESLKRVLPNLRGRLVDEQTAANVGETVLQVAIPPNAWPNLTTELINHGAVEVGPVSNPDPSVSSSGSGPSVMIRIRIVTKP
ncbi:MAG: hypothetical protein HY914_17440 [Desulfomonile tiedjei]|nr:hypothetical protein [Desulfomonile tiedjei]